MYDVFSKLSKFSNWFVYRSNSILNFGFVIYKTIKTIHFELTLHQKLKDIGKSEISTTIANILGDALVRLQNLVSS